MNLRILGRTGLSVSEIGFGCGPTAGLMINESALTRRKAVARAIELGINYFDTAPAYGDAISETHLGTTLHELGIDPIIATKVEIRPADLHDIADHVLRSVRASIARLRVRKVHVIQLHNRVGIERADAAGLGRGALLSIADVLGEGGVVEAFTKLRAEGSVDFFGCSSFGGDMAAVHALIESGTFDMLTVSYSLLNATAWQGHGRSAATPDYQCIGAKGAARNMGVAALRVLEGGALAGGGRSPAALAAARALAIELGEEMPLIRTALRFALSNRQISTVLVGFSDVRQIEDAAAAAAEGALPDYVIARAGG